MPGERGLLASLTLLSVESTKVSMFCIPNCGLLELIGPLIPESWRWDTIIKHCMSQTHSCVELSRKKRRF